MLSVDLDDLPENGLSLLRIDLLRRRDLENRPQGEPGPQAAGMLRGHLSGLELRPPEVSRLEKHPRLHKPEIDRVGTIDQGLFHLILGQIGIVEGQSHIRRNLMVIGLPRIGRIGMAESPERNPGLLLDPACPMAGGRPRDGRAAGGGKTLTCGKKGRRRKDDSSTQSDRERHQNLA